MRGLCLEPQWLTHGQPLRLVFAWPRFESRVRQGGKVRLLGAPGAADCFLGLKLVHAAAGIEGRC